MNEIASQQSDPIIRLEQVSVMYRTPTERIGTFKEFAIRWLQGKIKHNQFWALRDINMTVGPGEIFGLVGNNGAGKSTFLKLIARVIRPSAGRVYVKGMVAPLLELGAGFHPELSGRENVILNGAILGFSRNDMLQRLDSIINFSELHDFIDAPLRTYSSGMWARLGFSIATDLQPEILILDEVLAVGDESFQQKCLERIKAFSQNGTTILLVTHNMAQVAQMCTRAAWLSHGKLQALGKSEDVIQAYRANQPSI